jgi:hypothetical protein
MRMSIVAGLVLAALSAPVAKAAETFVCPAPGSVIIGLSAPSNRYQSNLPGWKASLQAPKGIVPLGFNGAQFDVVPNGPQQLTCYYATDPRGGTISLERALSGACQVGGGFNVTGISWVWQCLNQDIATCTVECR